MQNKNNKFVDKNYHKGSGSGGGLVMGRRQQNQNVSTSNMMIAKSIVGIGGDQFDLGNQVVPPGTHSKQSNPPQRPEPKTKSQPIASNQSTTATQQSHMTSLFSKGKFFQSHQYS